MRVLTRSFTPIHDALTRIVRENPGKSSRELAALLGKNGDSYVKRCLLDLVDAGIIEKKPLPGHAFRMRYYSKTMEMKPCTR